jgi:hypothetical protein
VGLRGWNATYSLLPFRVELALLPEQKGAKVFNTVLTNLGLFPRVFVSCLPLKRKEKAYPFHVFLLS